MSGEVMAALTVWKFSSPAGADEALDTLGRLRNQQFIQLHDAAVVSQTRPELIRTNLSAEQEAKLREVFSSEG